MSLSTKSEVIPRPYLIAGPCSAESETQVLEVAKGLVGLSIQYFRAGIWKPRTRPDSFEGVGLIGLPWLNQVQAQYGLKVCTEAANAQHVEYLLEHKIDAIWIGARTTVSPFSVQEIANALQGVDIKVFIKNPINPDLKLWMGAIERLQKANVNSVEAIHRGFSAFNDPKYRNTPRWQIPIELKAEFPDMTVLCDNSHICGRRDLLLEVAQKAMDLNFDGLMTEVHSNPDEAWSDAKQQITPAQYSELLQSLIIRKEMSKDSEFIDELNDLRRSIDHFDTELIELLGQRMQISEKIGEFKYKHRIAILQAERWRKILDEALQNGIIQGLSPQFVEQLYAAIHDESIDRQERKMRSKIN